MLLLVLMFVLVAFGLLLIALVSGTATWAWVSVAVSVAAAGVLAVDWAQRRAAVRSGDRAGSRASGEDVDPPTTLIPALGSAAEPATEVFPAVRATGVVDAAPDVAPERPEVQVPAASPSGSSWQPPGAGPEADQPDQDQSQGVTSEGAGGSEEQVVGASARSGDDQVGAEAAGDASASTPGTEGAATEESGPRDPASGPAASEAAASEEAAASSPGAAESGVSGPGASQAAVAATGSGPGVSGPDTSQAAASGPAGSGPAGSGPGASDTGARPDAGDEAAGGETGEERVRDDRPAAPDAGGTAVLHPGSGSRPAEETRSAFPPADPSQRPPSNAEVTQVLGPVRRVVEPEEERADPATAAMVASLDDEVLVIDERPRYHMIGCRVLVDRETIPLPVKEAVEYEFTPCELCTPIRVLAARVRSASKS